MKRACRHLPVLVTVFPALLMLLHGPIAQPIDYHNFADSRSLSELPNALDVMSNLGFAIIGAWGLLHIWKARNDDAIRDGWPGYRMFLIALILTAAGSACYHLHPDNARLVWDRIPIALACAGLLSAVHGEMAQTGHTNQMTAALGLLALASVGWWRVSGDLRIYLLMQGLPLLLIPLWQYLHGSTNADRRMFGIAIALYVLAKIAELHDHEILTLSGFISGHTLKHLIATAAAAMIAIRLRQRVTKTPLAAQAIAPLSRP